MDKIDADIEHLGELVREVRNDRTGGYEVEFEILPQQEEHRSDDGFFLVIRVASTDPGSVANGEWWFDDEDYVMQVL